MYSLRYVGMYVAMCIFIKADNYTLYGAKFVKLIEFPKLILIKTSAIMQLNPYLLAI